MKSEKLEDVKKETVDDLVKFENIEEQVRSSDEPETKKAKGMSLEEYEAALDQDSAFDGIDF